MRAVFFCQSNKEIGIGHLKRSLSISNALRSNFNCSSKFIVYGKPVLLENLKNIDFEFIDIRKQFSKSILENLQFDILFLDISKKYIPKHFSDFLKKAKEKKKILISIDGLIDYEEFLDLIFIPSFKAPNIKKKLNYKKIIFGWDCYLLDDQIERVKWNKGRKILALTGGSDPYNLCNSLPNLLNKKIDKNYFIDWVVGPFSNPPNLDNKDNNFIEHFSPPNLNSFYKNTNYVLTVYGVSFFESLYSGIPTVVFSANKDENKEELEILKKSDLALVAKDQFEAVDLLNELIENKGLALKLHKKTIDQIKTKGTQRILNEIKTLI